MSRPRSVLARVFALGAAVALLAGCATSGPSSSPSASPAASVSPVCAAATDLSAALTNFKDTLKSGATIGQIQAARDQVKKSYDDLVNAASDAAKDRVDAVKAAQQKFTAAVNSVPNDATLSQAANSLKDEAANVQAAISDLSNDAKC
ncbi:hypothetical protein SAMN05660473_00350 [Arthrobacter sp. 49Tsu3.1M3]|uniref:hypothetical protein n=1 Tax=Arthrobacter sp. 49Tsu3.1M3 TaxID=1279029 RepID=UPI0009C56732|nr:hypothetical protein [Arthrobacter sp. 49Tsu3.1M3]SKB36313.1 hypothetical protein SAMN05660473_00350 [Arthrobacter sp. 49Tsu3.1M3]